MKRLLFMITTLAAMSANSRAQSLSVANIEAQTGEETALVVSLIGGTSMTALQFNLSLPEGVSLKNNSGTYGTTLGEATDGHTLSVQPLASGDLLVILYSMEQKAFSDGELLRIPLKAGDAATTANGKLYTVRTATVEAVSHSCADASFSATVTEAEPEPITRTPFNGAINLPGTLEAENFDKGGEGITYHDSDAEDHGGTNYRSGADLGMDVVAGNGGYAVGWTNGGEWAEYTVNVTEAGMYTLEAIVSNGTENKGGFSISLVGDGGSLTKLADVSVPSTESNWEKYQSVKGDLLQSLEAGSQIFRITITDGNCNIDKIKFEKKVTEPEVTRTPFNGEISLPGTLEAENFDKGGEGITYHDNDAEDHGGTNYRSGADLGMDVVAGNGGYAVGWTNGGEWAEYTVNVLQAGKYTFDATVSNGPYNASAFSISLVGNDGNLTKLAEVNVPTKDSWDNYLTATGDLLQSLEAGTQILRITITTGGCNIDKIKFELMEEEPAYKVGDDITSLATAEWEGKNGDYAGLANPSAERYTNGAPNDVGDILTQTVTDLRNGTYKVQLDVAASFTPDRGFTCPTGDGLSVAFANGTQRNLAVVERGWVSEGEQKTITLTATVTDGTLKYGIRNLAPSGNWFVARLRSIVYVSESAQSPTTYTISITPSENGTTATDVEADEEGSRVFITATPNEECALESVKVTTADGQEVEVTNNSFIMPAKDVTVTATYKAPEVPDGINGINGINNAESGIYTLDGKSVKTLQKGVNIIRKSDNTVKKVYVK